MVTLLILFVLLYLFPCIVIGAIGLGLNDSFWFYFWVALLFTPIIGLIVVLYDAFWNHKALNPNDDFWENLTGNKLD